MLLNIEEYASGGSIKDLKKLLLLECFGPFTRAVARRHKLTARMTGYSEEQCRRKTSAEKSLDKHLQFNLKKK